jgi:hypothetical protein
MGGATTSAGFAGAAGRAAGGFALVARGRSVGSAGGFCAKSGAATRTMPIVLIADLQSPIFEVVLMPSSTA